MPLVKAVAVRISVTGGADAAVQIDRVRAKAAQLAAADPTIKVKVDTAAARLEMDLFRAGLRADLARAAADAGGTGRGGILGWLRGGTGVAGIKAGAAGGTGFFGTIGGALSGIASAGPAGIAVLAGLTAAAGVTVQALGGAIAATAGAAFGVGALGALAIPTFSKITAGVTAVGAATTKAQLATAWAAIPKGLRPAVQGVLDLQKSFDGLAQKMQPLVLRIGGVALAIAQKLMPVLLPLAQTAGKAVLGLLQGFDKFAGSAGFKAFIAQMQTLAGPAITIIGRGIGSIVISLGKLLQTMASPTGLVTLQLVFKGIAAGISLIGFGFKVLTANLPIVAQLMIGFANLTLGAFRRLTQIVLGSIGFIINGLAKAFGGLPLGIGASLKIAAASFDVFRKGVDNSLAGAQASLRRWSADVRNAPKIFKLQANITELQDKLATARALLADRRLTQTRRAYVEANIDQLQRQIARARAALAALNGTTATTYIQTLFQGGQAGHPTPPHAASGGWHSGWTMVGEMGRELVRLPQGSYVYPHAATERMAAGGRGGDVYVTVNVPPTAHPAEVGRQIAEVLKPYIKAGGNLYPAGVTPR